MSEGCGSRLYQLTQRPEDKTCPVCGDGVNAVIAPHSKLHKIKTGRWCFKNGYIFIHEALKSDIGTEGDGGGQ